MSVEPTTDQSVTLDVGDEWVIGILAIDADGYASDATVAVQITTPSGSTSAPAATTDTTGYYEARYTIAAAGRHLAVVTVSGDVVGVVPFTAWAATPTAASGMPTLAQVKTYLGDTSWSDADIADALAAETSAQRDVCRIPAVYPDALAQALKRRVARNLAARSVPVATFTSFEGGATSTRVPKSDAEVARLEAPYPKLRMG